MSSLPGVSLFDGMFQGVERVLDLRRIQHTITASNIANANTPEYHAKEIPFDQLLTEVMDRSLAGDDVDPADLAEASVTELDPVPWALDGNSVDEETEAVRLSENTLMYNAVAGGMSRRLALLRFAAGDGRS